MIFGAHLQSSYNRSKLLAYIVCICACFVSTAGVGWIHKIKERQFVLRAYLERR